MSTTDFPTDLPGAEELVAYLDGEMPPDGCRRVEQRLSTDAACRRELAELDQAWSALDELPRAVVTEDFARTTIEMVAVAAEHELAERSAAESIRWRHRLPLVAALCGIFAVGGYAAVRALLPNANAVLIEDLPVIAELDVLADIGDVEFLRGLSTIGVERFVLDEQASNTAPELVVSGEDWATPAGRRAWIERLSADQQAELAVRLARFENVLSDADRDRLRRLQQAIATADDSAALRTALSTYGQWIKSRTPGERITLRELPPGERLRKVDELVEQSNRFARRRLSAADEQALQEAILDFVDRRRQELMREVGRRGDPDVRRQLEGRSMAVVALVIIGRELRDDDRERRLRDALISHLSPPTQEYIESLPRRQRGRQLWWWCREALDPRYRPQDLERYFVEQLDADRREYLLGLPLAEMDEQLEQFYVGSQVGLWGGDWPGNGGPDRVGRGGPGPPGPRWNPEAGPRGRGPRDRFPGDGPPPDAAGRRRPPPRDFDDRRPDRGRFDGPPNGPPPLRPPPSGPPPDRRDDPPPEAI